MEASDVSKPESGQTILQNGLATPEPSPKPESAAKLPANLTPSEGPPEDEDEDEDEEKSLLTEQQAAAVNHVMKQPKKAYYKYLDIQEGATEQEKLDAFRKFGMLIHDRFNSSKNAYKAFMSKSRGFLLFFCNWII
jgi:hypothetical protein